MTNFTKSLKQTIAQSFDRLLIDTTGNIAIAFGVSAISIAGLMGAVVDYGQAGDVRARLQNAIDAATLSSASVNGTLDTTKARSVFAANFTVPGVTYDTPTFTQDTATGLISGSVTAHVPLSFSGLVGVSTVDIAASSTAYSEFPKVITEATFKTTSAQGAYDKEMYFVLLNAAGVITSRTKVLDYDYRYGQYPSKVYTPATNSSKTITVGSYDSYYVEVLVYEDLTYKGVRGSSTYSLKSNAANASTFLQSSGTCDGVGGLTMNWEDGGDQNFMDFVNKVTCVMTWTGTTKVRISG